MRMLRVLGMIGCFAMALAVLVINAMIEGICLLFGLIAD